MFAALRTARLNGERDQVLRSDDPGTHSRVIFQDDCLSNGLLGQVIPGREKLDRHAVDEHVLGFGSKLPGRESLVQGSQRHQSTGFPGKEDKDIEVVRAQRLGTLEPASRRIDSSMIAMTQSLPSIDQTNRGVLASA